MKEKRLVNVLLSCALVVAALAVVSPTSAADASISINAGGAATGSFTADQYYSGGSTYTNTRDHQHLADHHQPAAGRGIQ
jgi:hypothetical protein